MSDVRVNLPRRSGGNEIRDWLDQAACRDIDPDLFFPIGNAGPALLQVSNAKRVCARCLVRRPCLEWALETGQEAGVWGGTSEVERRAVRKRRLRHVDIRPDAAYPAAPDELAWDGIPPAAMEIRAVAPATPPRS